MFEAFGLSAPFIVPIFFGAIIFIAFILHIVFRRNNGRRVIRYVTHRGNVLSGTVLEKHKNCVLVQNARGATTMVPRRRIV